MRNDGGKALNRQAYHEATDPVRMLVFVRQRECQITDYDSRSTWECTFPVIRACTGFDRDLEDGEAIRRQMRQIANLKLNANDNFELAAA